MAHRLVWLNATMLAIVVLIAEVAFLTREDTWGPEGIDLGFQIIAIPTEMHPKDFRETLAREAQKQHVNIYKVVPGSRRGTLSTEYFVFAGDATRVLGETDEEAFPTFSSRYPAASHPGSRLAPSAIPGTYLVQGSFVQLEKLRSDLNKDAIESQPVHGAPTVLRWGGFMVQTPFGPALLSLWLSLLLATTYLASTRLPVLSLRRGLGVKPWTIVIQESIALFTAPAASIVAPTLLVILYSLIFRNGYRADAGLQIGGCLVPVTLGAAAVTSVIVITHSARHSISQLLKGARPHTFIAGTAGIVLIVSAFTSSGTASQALQALRTESAASAADHFRAKHQELYQPSLGYSILGSDEDAIHEALGAAFTKLEPSGRAWYCDSDSLDDPRGEHPDNEAPRSGTLVVNSSYFAQLPGVSSSLATRVAEAASEPGTAALVTPSGIDAQSLDSIIRDSTTWLDFQASSRDRQKSRPPRITSFPDENLGVVPTLDNLQVKESTFRVDPAVLVVNASSGLLSAQNLAVSGSYTDKEAFSRLTKSTPGASGIASLDSVAQMSEIDRADRLAHLEYLTVGIVVMMLSLGLAVGLVASTHFARHASEIFILSSTGSSFLSIFGRLLLVLSTTLAFTAGLAQFGRDGIIADHSAIGLAVTALGACIASAVLMTLLKSAHRTALEET